MAEPGEDEDLFADLYDHDDSENDNAPEPAAKAEPEPEPNFDSPPKDFDQDEPTIATGDSAGAEIKTDSAEQHQQQPSYGHGMEGIQNEFRDTPADEKPIGIKEDGKMFIGGLNWETTDESLKSYFSQFGEVVECTVMRDGATGRSRGFGFLTFKDPKVVNTVMVKEHTLDNKLIDPKRAIPRDEQERTAKIFVGGVSQDATESDFKDFFTKFGRVLDATLMMDKDTGRPRGFGFVTFDSELAVERTLEGPLAILGKPIEVKRAQPRGKMGEEEQPKNRWSNKGGNFSGGNGGGFGGGNQFGGGGGSGGDSGAENGNPNNMTPAMMAQYWQRMQQYFAMMQAQNQMNGGGMGGMNPMMMQMMQQRAQQGQMNPQMMQQMAAMQGYPGGMQGGNSPINNGGQGGNGGQQQGKGFSAQEQLMFEQQKYERQQMARMQGQNFGGQNTWDGMYDDVPAPAGMGPQGRGGFGGRGGRGGGQQNRTPQPAGQAPANAPTGPKNAGKPGANYRGGGRGGHRGFHPYARGGG